MMAEFSSLNSRLSVLEFSTKVRVDPVPPSPESQEDRQPEEFTNLETVEVTIDSVGITPPPGTTGTGPKSRLCKECPAPAAVST
jgi:hypothetical protein